MVGWAPVPENEATDPRIYVFGKDSIMEAGRAAPWSLQ